jgi:hypothetical protein
MTLATLVLIFVPQVHQPMQIVSLETVQQFALMDIILTMKLAHVKVNVLMVGMLIHTQKVVSKNVQMVQIFMVTTL